MTAALRIALEIALQLASDAYPDSRVEVTDIGECSDMLPDDMVDPANDTVCVEIWETCAHNDPHMPCYGKADYHIVEVDLSSMAAIAGYDSAYDVEWSID